MSFAFLLKLLLDMSALSRVNIPMYGVLKSATTPFVLLLDYVLRNKRASTRVQMSVYMTAMGGFVAGLGDLTFDLAGYVLALSSAMATAAYVVIVGKLGEELQLDSFTLLLYNNIWSLPFSFLLVMANGEMDALYQVLHPTDWLFTFYFLSSCASAFVLNLATYLCTLVNDSLTTSIVGGCILHKNAFVGSLSAAMLQAWMIWELVAAEKPLPFMAVLDSAPEPQSLCSSTLCRAFWPLL